MRVTEVTLHVDYENPIREGSQEVITPTFGPVKPLVLLASDGTEILRRVESAAAVDALERLLRRTDRGGTTIEARLGFSVIMLSF